MSLSHDFQSEVALVTGWNIPCRITSLVVEVFVDFLPFARKQLLDRLWKRFRGQLESATYLEEDFREIAEPFVLDHFAIVDLPSRHSGREVLQRIFANLDFVTRGKGYLANKVNDFIWMAESDADEKLSGSALPQVVLGDFRLAELSARSREIIEKLTRSVAPAPLAEIERLAQLARGGDHGAANRVVDVIYSYLTRRDHLLPSREEFETIRQENELLAWVLIFGKEINHFGITASATRQFSDLAAINEYVESMLGLEISVRGGKSIRGLKEQGIQQSATTSPEVVIELEGGRVQLPAPFMELVWRYSLTPGTIPELWSQYFTGFVAENADTIVESLYRKPA